MCNSHECRNAISGENEWVIGSCGMNPGEMLREIESLQRALRDCMSYIDVDNLTMQTKERNWQAVLDGESWNPANIEISR